MFSSIGQSALKPKLDNIKYLVSLLGIDLDSVPYIHVAGTNGKGSTCHIISATLQQAGFSVGLLTSPHLVDMRERVKINGELVSRDIVIHFVEKIQSLNVDIDASYFEMNVALAFYAFTQLKVDVAVIETGLGGRWDSTNIIDPILSIITSIDYDHTDILGDTLDKIAFEKAGIIKNRKPVLLGEKHPETLPVFTQVSLIQEAPIFFADEFFIPIHTGVLPLDDYRFQYKYLFELNNQEKHLIKTDLLGQYQWDNIRTAWAAIRILRSLGWTVTDEDFINAVSQVKQLTQLRGRWDMYSDQIILDVGHNPEGIQAAMKTLAKINKSPLIVYGSVKDKDVRKCVNYLPYEAQYFITQAQIPRALPVSELEHIFSENGFMDFSTYEQVDLAVEAAISQLTNEHVLLIVGSFFIVGEAYEYLDSKYK